MDIAGFILLLKYFIAINILLAILFAPAWLCRQNKKPKLDMVIVRFGSWVFAWTIIGWLFALIWSSKK